MTAFHDAVTALEPSIFVPLDAPGDSGTTAQDLMGGGLLTRTGGTRQDVVGSVAFTKELALSSEYWVADSTLEARIEAAVNGATAFTAAAWWRTTISTTENSRVIMALADDGFRMYRQFGSIVGTYYNASAVAQNTNASSTTSAETGGGWQLSGIQLDFDEEQFFVLRGGTRHNSTNVTAGSSVRTSSSTTFYYGAVTGPTSTWSGSLGPFAIWDRTLTADEWRTFYYAGLGIAAEDPSTYPILRRPVSRRMQTGVTLLREEDED